MLASTLAHMLLCLASMETFKPLFQEYTNKEEAFKVIRRLRARGVEDIKTVNLKPVSREPSDVGLAPRKKGLRYSINGVLIGAAIGFIISNLIFLVPALVLRFAHANLIGGLGVFLCTAACGALGLAMSFVYSKRTTREPRSGQESNSIIGVSVEAEDIRQDRLARRLMHLNPTSN